MSDSKQTLKLAPPLTLAWSWGMSDGRAPLLGAGLVIVRSRKQACEALDEKTGHTVWSFKPPGRGSTALGEAVLGDSVLVALGQRERMGQIRLKDGSLKRELPWRHQVRLKVAGETIFAEDATGFWAGRVEREKPIWRHQVSREPHGWAAGEFAVGQGRLVYGLKEGPVVCVDARTGREVWRSSIADLTSRGLSAIDRPGEVSGPIFVHEDVVIVASFPRHIVGLSLASGKRLWTFVGDNGMAQLYGGRFYVSAGWLSCRTGRLTKRGKLQWPEELQRKGVYTRGGWLISDTHLFVGTTHGYIVALERGSGTCAWYTRPDGAIGQIQSEGIVGSNGTLYYVDQSKRLFCFQEAKHESVRGAGRSGVRT